jgi:hypothetical protein
MKTLVSIFSIFFILILASEANAQNKFIEILSSDTVELRAVSLVYQVTPGQGANMFPMKTDRDENEPVLSVSNIKRLLDKNTFVYQVKGTSNYSIPGQDHDSSVLVTLNSAEELNRLFKVLSNVKGISGKVADVKYESNSAYKAGIYQRLYTKALADATLLAKVSNNTVGQLISVQEPQQAADMVSGYQEMFQKMFGNNPMFSQMFGIEANLTQKTEKKLLFKFELK